MTSFVSRPQILVLKSYNLLLVKTNLHSYNGGWYNPVWDVKPVTFRWQKLLRKQSILKSRVTKAGCRHTLFTCILDLIMFFMTQSDHNWQVKHNIFKVDTLIQKAILNRVIVQEHILFDHFICIQFFLQYTTIITHFLSNNLPVSVVVLVS